ncbi:MAG: hypothetical protein QOI66_1566, partial [Myxococcales bacterium]|nr:hypothetical protein [Myxococcales bacterium]
MDYRWKDDEAAKHHGDDLALLIYLSNVVGTDPTLTQPGGGNSSVKRQETDFAGRTVDVLRVKGSGTDLRTIAASGFTGLRMDDLGFLRRRDQMTDEEMMAFMRACMLDAREPAPSVETPLHSVLRHRFVVHTHDFATQALTDTPRPEALVHEALGPSVAYIDYVRPGFPLARAVSQLGPLPDAAKGLVLGRHGLIAWGHTAKDCYDNLFELINRSERFIASKRGSRPFIEVAFPAPSVAERRAKARQLLPVLRAGLGTERLPVLHWDGSDEA